MLRDILEAMAEQLRSTVGTDLASDGIDCEIEPRYVVSPSESPCIDIFSGSPARDSSAAGFGDVSGPYVVTVRARVSSSDSAEAQDRLTDFVDDQHDSCIAVALEEDQTLGGWATFVAVDADGFSGVLDFAPLGYQGIGCTWRVLVGQAVS